MNNAATGQGGFCSGDSGSPKFFEEVPEPVELGRGGDTISWWDVPIR
jgi:hypothetical protein